MLFCFNIISTSAAALHIPTDCCILYGHPATLHRPLSLYLSVAASFSVCSFMFKKLRPFTGRRQTQDKTSRPIAHL